MVYEDVMNRASTAFQSGKTRDVDFRRKQLQALLRMYEDNKEEMARALAGDLR
jgi:acyl-CoA reductase-like NAD-dependent aldehyde dehydrogenase